eukprot:Plantae.Rhodophyta-Palmaria_palmata.ctg28833.p1 GENE.Plantae.Rhodophyta-Palmaria_palmata.ctg28833~~Plantae.Rhodophyta-Palmaria_palmata.ctg28833.p1  ORF type:complete len:126 (+),score=17.21 Plantae.Rhodophyta-Palmaria_palmata.ctg28833:246-623(+)
MSAFLHSSAPRRSSSHGVVDTEDEVASPDVAGGASSSIAISLSRTVGGSSSEALLVPDTEKANAADADTRKSRKRQVVTSVSDREKLKRWMRTQVSLGSSKIAGKALLQFPKIFRRIDHVGRQLC